MPPRERKLDHGHLKVLPRSESSDAVRDLKLRSESTGAKAFGALALGTVAIGALAIGALAIGRLSIGRTRIRRLEIDELVVRKLRIIEETRAPAEVEAEPGVAAQEVDPSLRRER